MAEQNANRKYVIAGVFLLAGLWLLWTALDIQVLDNELKNKRELGMGRLVKYPARGLMYDREGFLLVVNEPIYDLMVVYNEVDWDNFDKKLFCRLLNIDEAYFAEAINKDWRDRRFSKNKAFPFLSKISAARFAGFQENLYQFPGFYAQLRNARAYPHRQAAHVLGYIGEAGPTVIKDSLDAASKKKIYDLGDYIGVNGLEKTYEAYLRGKKGVQVVLKDNMGRVYSNVDKGGREPLGGYDLATTLDLQLQRYAEELLQNKMGSIVAIQPKTGEILAMVSSPTYDPNYLTIGRHRGSAFLQLQRDSLKPLMDRSVIAQYPPGSPFKTLVALIGLQEGTLHPNRTIGCVGGYALGGKVLTGCHNHPTCTSVEMAIQHSCNAYFVTAYREILDKYSKEESSPVKGLNNFNKYLYQFGLGSPLGTDVQSEKGGNIPTSDYFGKIYAKESKWSSAWIRSHGIGQGAFLMTNLQMANWAAAIANRGYYITPHLVRGFVDENGKAITAPLANDRHEIHIDPQYFTPVIDGMEKVTTAGTARLAAIPGVAVCGKTGTAENNQGTGKDHSVFFAFAPKENPEIAIAVYVENGGWGGSYAAPIASLVIEKHLHDSIGNGRAWLEKRMLDTDLINPL